MKMKTQQLNAILKKKHRRFFFVEINKLIPKYIYNESDLEWLK